MDRLYIPYGELDVLELRVADCWAKDAARLNANRYRAALRHQVLPHSTSNGAGERGMGCSNTARQGCRAAWSGMNGES